MTAIYSPKNPGETIPIAWNFGPLLLPGETISTCTWTIFNPQNPGEDVSGLFPDAVVIDGGTVKRHFTQGVSGASYYHNITIATSQGNVYVETPTQLVIGE
ncbi:MAG: hypothetical protein ABFD89_09910 [Bryobacteraceae bacterium]